MSVLEMKGISKSFGPVRVLQNVNLRLESGEVLALLGENGAGKSTLMKILTGVYKMDEGEILIDGQPVKIDGVQHSREMGIEIIHQELSLFGNLSIAENFLIGHEEKYKRALGFIDYKQLHEDARSALHRVRLNKATDVLIKELGVGEQQLVEIARALQSQVRFLVMDEPTAALTEVETERLFELIQDLKAHGVGVVYISHRMEELFKVADTVEILRDGNEVGTRTIAEAQERELISLMVGREMENRYPRVETTPGDVLLQVKDMSTHRVKGVNLEVRRGEIVGLGGLMGAGRTEVARGIAGVDRVTGGEVRFKDGLCHFRNPQDAIQSGMVLVTEDRKGEGLVLPFTTRENLALPTLDARKLLGLVNRKQERSFAADVIRQLRIKVSSPEQTVGSLSGGNQQKVVLGKWLAHNPDLFILDEPTRGVDVGAKQEIYQLMNDLVAQGKGILMISSDLPELLGMCDRIYVMYQGTTQGEVANDTLNQEDFMTLATGGTL